MGEVVEKATNSPKIIKIIMGGVSHHFLFCHRYERSSLSIIICFKPTDLLY